MSHSICILRSNPVNPDSRVEKEAKALKEAGNDVTILAWDRFSDYKPKKEIISIDGVNIDIVRIGHKASYGEGMKNIVPYLKFQFDMRKWLKKNSKNFSVVHACDFDTAFFSRPVVQRKKIKFVFDIFDFLCEKPENIFESFVKKSQIKIINKADATIVCTEERINQIYPSKPKKIIVVHNTPENCVRNNLKADNDKITVAYVGILHDDRLLQEMAEWFIEHPQYEFKVGGFGLLEDYFRKCSSEYSNIKFYGKLPYAETLKLESQADIMTAIYDPSEVHHYYAAPNKFYEALMLGKPLIMIKNTGMSSLLEKEKIGVVIDYSKEGFGKGVEELISNRDNWEKISDKMKHIYDEQYNWNEMKKRLIAMYNEL